MREFRLPRPRLGLIPFVLLLALAAIALPRGVRAQGRLGRASPPQPQQHQGVEDFAGSWKFSWTGRESAITAGPRTGTVAFTRLGDGNFLEMNVEGTSEGTGPYKESGAIGIHFESEPVQVKAETLRLRRSYSIISGASFLVTEEISVNGGPFMRLGNGEFRKNP